MSERFEVVGLLKVRGHCLFTWHETEIDGRRTVEVHAEHCEECIAELRRIDARWLIVDLRATAGKTS